jgi:SAM-dependent methyltransferase
MQMPVRTDLESHGRTPHSAGNGASKGGRPLGVLAGLLTWMPSKDRRSSGSRAPVAGPPPTPADGQGPILTDMERELTHLRMEIEQIRKAQAEYSSETPIVAGTGLVEQIVPPIAGYTLRATVSSASAAGYFFIADAWNAVLSRFLKADSTVLDIGCGCGKMARNLVYHPYVKRYIGFDAYRRSIEFCQEHIAPRTNERFEFHYIDVQTQAYNPHGTVRGDEVVFPAADASVDFAFAASLFTHLAEADCKRYLQEMRRVLAPGGIVLPTIHVEPASGSKYSGNEIRIDIDPDYFIQLATDAGLRLVQPIGAVCGQEAFLFTAG